MTVYTHVGLDTAPVPASWVELAACRGRPTELWFAPDVFSQRVAVAVCRQCEVRTSCLAEALAVEGDHRFGIRGGLTASERGALAR